MKPLIADQNEDLSKTVQEQTARTTLCPWCGTRNEPGHAICRACGITVRTLLRPTPLPVDTAAPEATREDGCRSLSWLIPFAVIGFAALVYGGVQWRQQRAQAKQAERQAAEAQTLIAQALQRAPQVNARARDHLRRREFELGLAVVNESLREVEVPQLLETKVDLLNNAGRWDEAYLTLLQLLNHCPEAAHLHRLAGLFALNVKHDPQAALPHYERAVELQPDNSSYRIALANMLVRAGRLEEGWTAFEELVEADPQCLDCWHNYANALANAGEFIRGMNRFGQAVIQHPDNPRFHFYLAQFLYFKGKLDQDKSLLAEAAGHYRRSLELRPMPNSMAARRIHEITGQRVPPELEGKVTEEIEMEVAGKVNIVRATINGVEGRFILDTGASYTAIYAKAAKRYHLSPARRTMEIHTANGTVQVPVAYGDLQVGRHMQDGAVILLLPNNQDETDGLLGKDFLNQFDMEIRSGDRRLILRGNKGDPI